MNQKQQREVDIHIGGGVGYVGFLPPNSRLRLHRGGGGGWGEPLVRDPDMVRGDVLDELVTIEGARKDYGVVIDPATNSVDVAGTAELRRRMRECGYRADGPDLRPASSKELPGEA